MPRFLISVAEPRTKSNHTSKEQKENDLIKTFTCRIPGDTFGFDSVTMGDVDKDGTIDFLITSGWSGVHGFRSGRVFIISSGVKTK